MSSIVHLQRFVVQKIKDFPKEHFAMIPPKYFLAVFGDPKPPEKDTIESGVYHPDPKFAPFPPEPGDVLLLYCTGGYDKNPMQVPGIGIVLDTEDEAIRYRYLPLSYSISKTTVENEMESADAKKFANRRFSSHWLFEISQDSFVKVIGDRTIVWP